MNVRDIVIAPHRRAVFSTTMRTGIFKDGKLTKQEPGAYRFGYVNVHIFYSASPTPHPHTQLLSASVSVGTIERVNECDAMFGMIYENGQLCV